MSKRRTNHRNIPSQWDYEVWVLVCDQDNELSQYGGAPVEVFYSRRDAQRAADEHHVGNVCPVRVHAQFTPTRRKR